MKLNNKNEQELMQRNTEEREQREGIAGESRQTEVLAAGLGSMLNTGRSLKDALLAAVKTAELLTGSEHIFLHRYNQVTGTFSACV